MAEEKILGLVANIQRYSVNDGPGIRTAVFLKGCHLGCKWCHNVEMIAVYNEVWFASQICTDCGKCIEVCPQSAIEGTKDERKINRDLCKGDACLRCVEVCPTHATTAVATLMTVEEVLKEIQKDDKFYWRDEGGATVSGGEPLVQHRFVTELLKQCQEHAIHTCLETCGYSSWDILSRAAKNADLVLYDIKHTDSAKHEWGTGVPNELILENARNIAKVNRMRVRIPVIPGFNETDEELGKIADFIKSIGVGEVDILPYHQFGIGKYVMYLKDYELTNVKPPGDERMQDIKAMFEQRGLDVTIGG